MRNNVSVTNRNVEIIFLASESKLIDRIKLVVMLDNRTHYGFHVRRVYNRAIARVNCARLPIITVHDVDDRQCDVPIFD